MPSLTMEIRFQSSGLRSPRTTRLFYLYLKPGFLTRLKYSKISARCREIDAQKLSLDSVILQPHSVELPMNGIPCFDLRVKKDPRCFKRKRLFAATPIFSETES